MNKPNKTATTVATTVTTKAVAKKSKAGRKPIYTDYTKIPFSKMKVGETFPLTDRLSLKGAKSIEKSILRKVKESYKTKKFEVDITPKNIILKRVK